MTLSSIIEKIRFLSSSPMSWTEKSRLLYYTVKLSLQSKLKNNNERLIDSSAIYTFYWNKTPLSIRPMDMGIFYDVFLNNAYAIPEDWVIPKNPTVIDLGGHIGLVSRYYFDYFKSNANFHIVEPNPKNYALLIPNTNHQVYKKYPVAISNKLSEVKFSINGLGHNSRIADQGISVQTTTFSQFLIDNNIQCVDILKIDVEGAETQIFESIKEWKHMVKHIILEYHYDDTETIKNMLENNGIKFKIV